jgi:predicted DNA repair protein MutK
MAGSSLLMLIDDIATLLDDISVMTKVAAKKTAGVLGDDLALNANQVTGLASERELPVVWAVAKGSAINKAILVPGAIAISILMPFAITPLLMAGGAFLCFEGFEKIAHKWLHPKQETDAHREELHKALLDPHIDMVALEKEKINGAVRTDFILSAEIVVISLGTVANETMIKQVGVLIGISLIMTVGVYGLVAGIVRLDDIGLWLLRQPGTAKQKLGRTILVAAPVLMKTLSVLGTAAMFLVGGGIVAHGVHAIEDVIHDIAHAAGPIGDAVLPTVLHGVVGILVGAVIVALVTAFQKLRGARAH